MLMTENLNPEEAGAEGTGDGMAALERQLAPSTGTIPAGDMARKVGFVSAGVESQSGVIRTPDGGRKITANQEDIDLPEESDSEDDSREKVEIAQKTVPSAVFGDLAPLAAGADGESAGQEDDSHLGALERIKRQRKQ